MAVASLGVTLRQEIKNSNAKASYMRYSAETNYQLNNIRGLKSLKKATYMRYSAETNYQLNNIRGLKLF